MWISGAFLSCEKEVILEFDEEQSLAIFSLFSPNSIFDEPNFNIEVTATQSILDNSLSNYINDATVTITTRPLIEELQVTYPNDPDNDPDNSQGGSEDPVEDPEVESPHQVISEEAISTTVANSDRIIYRTDNTLAADGFSYTLTVEHPDYPAIKAESHVPKTTPFNNLELSEFKTSKKDQLEGFTRYFSRASFELDNTIDARKQYHLVVYQVIQFPDGSREHIPITIDENVLAEQIGTDATIVNLSSSLVFFGAHFDNSTFENGSQKLNFDVEFSLEDDSSFPVVAINVELRSVSKEYHNYFVEGYRLSQAGSNTLFVQSTNISNNIEGGFGLFAGYSVYNEEVPFRK